jgi:hypothetical protein
MTNVRSQTPNSTIAMTVNALGNHFVWGDGASPAGCSGVGWSAGGACGGGVCTGPGLPSIASLLSGRRLRGRAPRLGHESAKCNCQTAARRLPSTAAASPRRAAASTAEESVAAPYECLAWAWGETKASVRVIVVCSAAGQTMVFGAQCNTRTSSTTIALPSAPLTTAESSPNASSCRVRQAARKPQPKSCRTAAASASTAPASRE